MLRAIRDRNALDTAAVVDVVLGCVAPLGEQGADIARVAALNAGYAQTVAGMQVHRFCASGLEACSVAKRDGHMRPQATMQSPCALKPAFAAAGELFGPAIAEPYPEAGEIARVHHAGKSSGIA